MKYFFCSDIHGSAPACEKLLNQFSALKCDKIILLGDVLYHGPRNNLPQGYDPKKVIALLNPLSDKIIACRGNCDAEVDQMVLHFPLMADYTLTIDNGITIFASHGHVYSPLAEDATHASVEGSKLPPLSKESAQQTALVLYGHTHVQKLYKSDSYVVCNPGSPSIPKENSPAGFAVYENRLITLYDLDGQPITNLSL
jgi:uncharacterized protein